MNTRKSIQDGLNVWCHFARKNDYVEVTEWSNGEGFDVVISSVSGNQLFQLTHGEFDAIKHLIDQFYD